MKMINKWNLALITCILFVLSSTTACRNEGKKVPTPGDTSFVLPEKNSSVKWQLDDPTRKNVGGIKTILNDPALQKDNYNPMVIQLQNQVDQLVRECTMEGPAHEALHVWLEQFITDLKKLKTSGNQSTMAYQQLKKDVDNFDKQFA